MTSPDFSNHREHLRLIREAAVRAADPQRTVSENLLIRGANLQAGDRLIALSPSARIFLIAFGKAAIPMTSAAAAQLGSKLAAGVAAVPRRPGSDFPARVQAIPAGHPLPDEGSLAAGAAAAAVLRQATKDDLVLVLISGGGSAMFERPHRGITLEDLRLLQLRLLHSGAPIEDFNTVRRALSSLKAGGLARLSPARCVALILSDVVGDRLSLIASGPTVLRRASREAARAVLQRYGLWQAASASIRTALSQKPPIPSRAPRPVNVLVGRNRQVVDAARLEAEALGFPSRIVTYRMRGEAREIGKSIATRLVRAPRPHCLLMGGDTTVTVTGPGRGGRNQELALAAGIALDGIPGAALMALATDGVDGPTDSAGALVDGDSVLRMRAQGVDPLAALASNDAYPALQAIDALIQTGPTQTNLNDLVVALAYEHISDHS